MRFRRSAIAASVVAFCISFVLVVAAFAFVALLPRPSTSPPTTSSSGTESSSTSAITTSNASVQGLELRLAENTTTLVVGQRLGVNVSLFNDLPSPNTVATSDDWLFQGVPIALWPPCYANMPVEAVVLMGNYSLQELPPVANVTFPVTCAEAVIVNHAVFQPSSSQANITGIYDVTGTNETLGPFVLSASFTTSGSWDLLNNSQRPNPPILNQNLPRQPTATPFVPGVYTLAVADEWGQAAVLHFQVSAESTEPVEVISVTGPIPPYNPGGPVVSVSLKNVGQAPITSLNATLPSFPPGPIVPYSFVFNVTSSNPLLPGQNVQDARTLIGASIDSTVEYPLTISGTLLNGTQFSYTVQVQIVPPD